MFKKPFVQILENSLEHNVVINSNTALQMSGMKSKNKLIRKNIHTSQIKQNDAIPKPCNG